MDFERRFSVMGEMYFQREMVDEKMRGYAEEARERRMANTIRKTAPTLKARLAKRLFEAAITVERNATWKAVWDRLETPKHS